MVEGFDNIGVCVTNLQSSVAFYELLGLREAYRNERGVLMAAGDARLFLFATRRADPPPCRSATRFGRTPTADHEIRPAMWLV
jgi:catechol 2,3-dioxygenase-like lactoylglutathione lyase family enzyme